MGSRRGLGVLSLLLSACHSDPAVPVDGGSSEAGAEAGTGDTSTAASSPAESSTVGPSTGSSDDGTEGSSTSTGAPADCVWGSPQWLDVTNAAYDLALADVDNDHDLDVVLVGGVMSFFYNAGGAFEPPIDFGIFEALGAVRVLDVNGDDKVDYLLGNRLGSPGLFVGIGLGGSGFLQYDHAVAEGVWSIATGDFDGDDDIDIAVPTAATAEVHVLINDGRYDFIAGAVVPTPSAVHDLHAADLDGDGDVDLVHDGEDGVRVLHNDGSGAFDADESYAGGASWGLQVVDLDGDGDLDVVAGLADDDALGVWRNEGDGALTAMTSYPAIDGARWPVVVDADGDGMLDLVSPGTTGIAWLINRGDATFGEAATIAAGNVGRVAAGDVDGDGWPDLALADDVEGRFGLISSSCE